MKRIALPLLTLLFLLTTASSNPLPSNPEETVKKFYGWYLRQLNHDDFTPLKNRNVALQYLTPELLRRVPRLIRETDADVFICAQDVDPAWEKNFKVDVAVIKGPRAVTSVHLVGREMGTVKVKLILKESSAGWRIDSTDCTN